MGMYDTHALQYVRDHAQVTWLLYLQHVHELEQRARAYDDRPTLHRMPVIIATTPVPLGRKGSDVMSVNTRRELQEMIDRYALSLATEQEATEEYLSGGKKQGGYIPRDTDDSLASGAKISAYEAILSALRAMLAGLDVDYNTFIDAMIDESMKLEAMVTHQHDAFNSMRDGILDTVNDEIAEKWMGK